MMMSFDSVCTVRVTHGYFDGEVSDDFEFVIPDECARMMQRMRLLCRVREGVLHVLGGAANGARRPINGALLRVGLKLRNPALCNVTEPPLPIAPVAAVYRNHASAMALDSPESRVVVGNVFTHSLPVATRPATVTLKDSAGSMLRTAQVHSGAESISFDLAGTTPGLVKLEEDDGHGANAVAFYYLHPEWQSLGVQAIVEIDLQSSFYAAPPTFAVHYEARRETLRYYVVVAPKYSPTDAKQLSVFDAGASEDGRALIGFQPEAPTDERAKALLAAGAPTVAVFASQAPVARRARGRKKINLRRNGEVLIEHLPQPGTDRADSNMILHISK